jgi:hypothetical protein
MTKTTYTALTPTGEKISRTSASKAYSHVVLCCGAEGWAAYAWASREELAHAKAREAATRGCSDVRIVPVLMASTRSSIAF